jgi:serine/threonine-protein kinase
MSLASGTKLAHYEIVESIGKGGMGEVYRARDTKLKRDVAVKIVPEDVADDRDRMARFQREAEVLASLNHPHIAAIYGLEESDGLRALILELVEGSTLREHIAASGNGLPLEEALAIAGQIAEALEFAHAKRIVHRDLKPDNVKLTSESDVKVLDFGLAKALEGDTSNDQESSHSPTLTRATTQAGVLLGTAAYMSPEQARGQSVDKRADVFAFGCVLYEMLTGKRAFHGETVSDTLASVLKTEPDWDALPPSLPGKLRALLRRCLAKNRAERMRDIGDVGLEIAEVLSEGSAPETAVASAPMGNRLRERALWVSGLAVCIVLALSWSSLRRSAPTGATRLTVTSARDLEWFVDALAISPDGRHLVYGTREGGDVRFMLRSMDSFESRSLPGTEEALAPFFSPDGRSIGFFAGGRLQKLALDGSAPTTLVELPSQLGRGASWAPDGTIVYATWPSESGLSRVSEAGGETEILTTIDAGANEAAHRWPHVLPNGRGVVFTTLLGGIGDPEGFRVDLLSFDTGETVTLVPDAFDGRYVASGHLVYVEDTTIFVAPFDLDSTRLTGPAVPVVADVASDQLRGYGQYAISENGTLAYLVGRGRDIESTLVWVSRDGKEQPLALPPRSYRTIQLSPDGGRLALGTTDALGLQDISVYDLERGTLSLLTPEHTARHLLWTPDGERMTFSRSTDFDIYWMRADGGGIAERLVSSNGRGNLRSSTWTPDGRGLLFVDGARRLWLHELDDPDNPRLLVDGAVGAAAVSPDGRWLAYALQGTTSTEIFVQAFPEAPRRWQISSGGGTAPVWARDGSELYYHTVGGPTLLWMAVSIETPGGELSAGRPRPLLPPGYGAAFGGSVDGVRFLTTKPARDETESQLRIQVVLNWFSELE